MINSFLISYFINTNKGGKLMHKKSTSIIVLILFFIICFSNAAEDVKKAVERDEIDPQYKWRMEDIYATDEDWEKDFERLEPILNQFTELKGTLAESPQNLLQYLKLDEMATLLAVKLSFYSNRKLDEDARVDKYQGYKDKMSTMFTKFGQLTAWAQPEIMQIPEEKIWEFVNNTPELQIYHHYFDDLLRQKAHVLSEKEEEILALAGDVTSAPYNIFNMFNNADIKFPDIIDEDGNTIELTKARYQTLMKSPDRDVRRRAWEANYSTYENWKNTLAANLAAEVKTNIFYAKARKYNSALEAALDSDNLPIEVYNNLVKSVNDNLEPLHRYISLRKKVLGIDNVHLYDLYAPLLPEVKWEIDYEEAKKTALSALKPLGKEYLGEVKNAFKNGWIDVYENVGKRSGAYNASFYGLAHPYILLNYQNKIGDVFTLGHEIGHSLHAYYTQKNQPFIYGSYTIFLAEVASTFNEALLTDYLLKQIKDKQKRLYLLNEQIENILVTVYTQVLFAEFEQKIHETAEAGEPLNATSMNKIFAELQQKYYGPDFVLDPMGESRWNRIPHYYRNFYVFKYATGMAASTLLSQKIIQGNKKARDVYLKFLSSGSSDYDINLLKEAGVDMTSPEPVATTLKLFDELLTEMEKLML
jgi:oligoendopeptidase F